MNAIRILLRILLAFIILLALLAAVLFGIRTWNQSQAGDVSIPDRPPDVEGVTITDFSDGYAKGFHLMPKERKHPGTVVIFGGSEGSANPYDAAEIAKTGREVYALYFFGQEGQRENLTRVPLELFDDALPHLSKPISVVGASKGAELVLMLSTYYPEIEYVAAIAPPAHHWQGLGSDYFESLPSFTWKGEDLPFLHFSKTESQVLMDQMFRMLLAMPVTFRNSYDSVLERSSAEELEQARIKVENTEAKYFLVAGEQDKMWNAADAARKIKQRIGERAEVHSYPDAGHAPGAPETVGMLRLGGTEEANKAMDEDVMKKLDAWLP
ncbi:acyl-CoA thioester hydrolase/BAAT C-terminal domain-containing protein [Corynebacterium sp.]|uniref:acyl-CoA thioester hydrolase/BAAT C-terminal domain-containing protein n=1 Tax=Corynebacterium sp. TaxID=1720 RepID=UPI0026DC2867|nr:acyl-CoA thioester hydrolase/BAAT C-terminal domain-containing protein [Corynebacterium sp.]MDO5076704.1 acyl-CoA thioester hydrolase/BAAT C-terminal domain-containing protein [Corynebacterium sp.]